MVMFLIEVKKKVLVSDGGPTIVLVDFGSLLLNN